MPGVAREPAGSKTFPAGNVFDTSCQVEWSFAGMASGIDFRTAQKKLDARAKHATEKAQRKLERDRLIAERRAQHQEAVERELQNRRLAELAVQEREKEERERLIEANDGVLFREELLPVVAPESLARQRGIKRASDKVLLPASVGRQLIDQDAHRKGVGGYFFELESLETGRRTVSSVLDFSAAEGFVALPKKVARCLFGLGKTDGETETDECDWESMMAGRVKVTYKRLRKGTRCVFQPRVKAFQIALNANPSIDIKICLENCLSAYSCLAVGDWVPVTLPDHDGPREFDLRVKELEVNGEAVDACSIIDTDLEAEVHPSIETEERMFQEELRARQLKEERARAAREAELAQEAETAARVAAVREASTRLQEIAEPAPAEAGVTSVMVRFPDGNKCSRSFRVSDPVWLLFCFVDSNGASGLLPGEYKLVSQYPRVEIESGSAGEGNVGQLECFRTSGGGSPRSLALFVEKR